MVEMEAILKINLRCTTLIFLEFIIKNKKTMKITVSQLRQIIREEIKRMKPINENVLNFKNGVSVRTADKYVTLSHPKYGTMQFKKDGNATDRWKTPDGGDVTGLNNLVNKFADGTYGKGDKPYKKFEKPKSEPKPAGPEWKAFDTKKYKNGVVVKTSNTTQNVWLSHPDKDSVKVKFNSRYGEYKPEGSSKTYDGLMDLIKAYKNDEF